MDTSITLNNEAKYEFLTKFILNRARIVPSTLNGYEVAREALKAWNHIAAEFKFDMINKH